MSDPSHQEIQPRRNSSTFAKFLKSAPSFLSRGKIQPDRNDGICASCRPLLLTALSLLQNSSKGSYLFSKPFALHTALDGCSSCLLFRCTYWTEREPADFQFEFHRVCGHICQDPLDGLKACNPSTCATNFLVVVPNFLGASRTIGRSESPVRCNDAHRQQIRRYGCIGLAFPPAEQPTQQGHSLRRVEKDSIDYAVLRSWVAACQSFHAGLCHQRRQASFENFRLIDCDTLTLVDGGAHEYVALSYVWGGRDVEAHESIRNAPVLIKDAMTVTKNLGYRFLWVDRYCIEQTDSSARMHQLRHMALIFHQAEITIVAVSSDSPDMGLPGVSSRWRDPQPTCNFKGRTFTLSLGLLDSTTADSTWRTRAWTFQEDKMSRRRLFFTREKVIFNCHSSVCDETVVQPQTDARSSHVKTPLTADNGVTRPPFIKENIFELIHQYCGRNVTFGPDMLYAFLGVFSELEPNWLHVWGLPVYNNGSSQEKRDSFVRSMFWTQLSASRNECLPSWSWIGWKDNPGRKVYFPFHFNRDDIQINKQFQVHLLSRDKAIRSWDISQSSYGQGDDLAGSTLHVEAPCLPVEFVAAPYDLRREADNTAHIECISRRQCSANIRVYMDAGSEQQSSLDSAFEGSSSTDQDSRATSDEFFAVVLGYVEQTQGRLSGQRPPLFILVRMQGKTATRVGVVNWSRIYPSDHSDLCLSWWHELADGSSASIPTRSFVLS